MQQSQYIAVYGLIYNQNHEVLLVKRSPHDTLPNVWELPGGVLEFGEDPIKAVEREVKEETNLDITPAHVITIGSYFKQQTHQHALRIAYYCKLEAMQQVVKLSNDHSDYAWLDPFNVTNMLLSDFLLRVIEEVRK